MKKYFDIVFIVVLSMLGFAFICYSAQPFGLGVTGDSIYYLSGADGIAGGLGYIDHLSRDITNFPPLLSFLVALFLKIPGTTTHAAYLIINAISYSIAIFFYGLLFRDLFKEKKHWFYFGTAAILLSRPFFVISTNVATDPLLFAEQGCFFYLINLFLEKKDKRHLFLIAVLANIMLLTR
jgi:hypothetical protein